MTDDITKPFGPVETRVLRGDATYPIKMPFTEPPAELAAAVAAHLADFGPRILAMSQRPADWPVFLDRLTEQIRKQSASVEALSS